MIYTFTVPSYHNDPALKAAFIKELRWHKRQDKFTRGTYGEGDNGDFRGCAVGCSLHSLFRLGKTTEREWDRHDLFPELIGVPEWLAHLADEIFEHSPEEYAMGFTARLFAAIPVGVDLTLVKHTVMAMILDEETKCDRKKWPQVSQVVKDTSELHKRAARGETVTAAQWSAAESAAMAAARAAAEEVEPVEWAARAAAMSARMTVESVALAAGWAARMAAEGVEPVRWATWSEAEAAAMSAVWKRVGDKTIKILKSLEATQLEAQS